MATRIPAAVVGISLLSLVVATLVGLAAGSDLDRELTDDQLIALRSSGASDVERHMTSLMRSSEALAASPQTATAIEAFSAGHRELLEVDIGDLVAEREQLAEEYEATYLAPLRDLGRKVQPSDLIADNPAAIQLQILYGVGDGPQGGGPAVSDASDGSAWTDVHQDVHPLYRDIVERRGLVDLYLIEPRSGYIVYSTNKRADLGTSLEFGPFSGTPLANLASRALLDPEVGALLGDLAFYDAYPGRPVGAIASPVVVDGQAEGVLVLLYDSEPLTSILNGGAQWDEAGFPPGGESVLIGGDGTMRSEPRAFLEDPRGFLAGAGANGKTTTAERELIVASGTTVLTQRAADATVQAGVDGSKGVERRVDTLGEPVFSTSDGVDLEGVRWLVATEVDVEVAEGGFAEFEEILVVGTAAFVVALTFAAVAWGARIMSPIREIGARLEADPESLEDMEIPPQTPTDFQRLVRSFASMSSALTDQRRRLDAVRAERLDVLRQMLPPSVADRLAAGDIRGLEEIPQVSIVAVVVLGLGALVREEGGTVDRELVERIHGELDDLAGRHGVERMRVLGAVFFGAGGPARAFIDRAPRAVAFAQDAEQAVRALGMGAVVPLSIAVGIDTGPVTVGFSGGERLLYDIWGAPVTAAHQLARRAGQGQILVSESTRDLLPQSLSVTPTDGAGTMWLVAEETGEVRG
ncbi:MAG: adenylate/guanylate cyclase domain-containing protein [Actinomycetia bacterium]|nr:adenylate/guanylate cyclase domain-containing protein [Actinomycetes bacterium]